MSKAQITINPTSRCTLNCIYCHTQREDHKTLTFNQLQNSLNFIANQLPDVDEWNLHFNSHDVLLCWDDLTKQCIEYYDTNNTSFSLHTNGILLTQEKAKFLQDHNVTLMISLDGPKHIQDINRRFKNNKSSYDFIINKINMLQKMNYPTHLVATFNDQSIKYIYDSYKFFIEQEHFFSFLFDIKYSKYDKNDLINLFNKIAVDFARQPANKQKLFRLYYRCLHPASAAEYKLIINTGAINAMVNKHSLKKLGQINDNNIIPFKENFNLLTPVQNNRCAHNKILCLKCPAFHGEFSHFPKYNMEIYCLFLQELFKEIKKIKGEDYFDLGIDFV